MDGHVIPPKRVTSPTWGPSPPCKQALKDKLMLCRSKKNFPVDTFLSELECFPLQYNGHVLRP